MRKIIHKKYFGSNPNSSALLILSLSLTLIFSCYLFYQNVLAVSVSGVDPLNSTNITIVHDTIIGSSGTVNVSSLPPVNMTGQNNFTLPFHRGDPKGYEDFQKQLASGNYSLALLPQVPAIPIKNKNNPLLTNQISPKTVTIDLGFDGINQTSTNHEPPDVQIAAGPTYLMEMVNRQAAIYTKTGTLVSSFSLASFFSFNDTHILSDPRVIFDSQSQRWFASFGDYDNYTEKIAVSNSDDPTGPWHFYHLFYTKCQDQPTIATSDDKFVITVDRLGDSHGNPTCAPGALQFDVDFIIMDKKQMTTSQDPLTTTERADSSVRHISPAKSLSSTSDLFMVANDHHINAPWGNVITIYKISGSAGSPTVSSNYTSTLAVQADPIPAIQEGTAITIDVGDHRVNDAVWFKGKLWFAWQDACVPVGDNSARTCAHLFTYNTNNLVTNEIEIGNYHTYYFYPAVTMDSAGGMSVIFGESSAFDHPSLYVTGQAPYDPQNSVEGLTNVASGSQVYTGCRYGDYYEAAVDPSSPLNMWLAGEYQDVATIVTPPNCSSSTPAWSTFIVKDPIWCQPPLVPSDWTISSSCTMGGSYNAPLDVYISNNSVLTIPNGITVGVNFASHKVFINPGSGILINPGGSLKQD